MKYKGIGSIKEGKEGVLNKNIIKIFKKKNQKKIGKK